MSDQIVLLTSSPNQRLSVNLNIDGSVLTLQLQIYYSEVDGQWIMAILDKSGNLILSSIPMLTGEWPSANMLASYAYLAIGSAYIINASKTSQDNAGPNNLGTDFQLLWSDTAA